MVSLLVTLGVYAVIVLGVVGGAWAFINSHDNSVRQEQIAADTVVLERVKQERDAALRAEKERASETQQCVAASAKQSAAVADIDRRGRVAQEVSRKIVAEAQAKAAANAGEVVKLRALASAAPAVDQSCQETLARTDAILRSMVKVKAAK